MFETIAEDSKTGATELTVLAARELERVILASRAADSGAMWGDILAAVRELVAAKREMAPVINLASAVLASAERAVLSGLSVDTVRHSAVAECAAVSYTTSTDLADLAKEGRQILPEGGRIATLSASESVRAILLAALEDGADISIVISESRPMMEGAKLAGLLASAGVSVTLVVDAALPSMVKDCSAVLVGADSISEKSFVNKTGTLALALAARESPVAFYAAALSSKLIPEAMRGAPDRLHDPAEVMDAQAPGLTAENRYFEAVPLALVTGVITEDGVFSPGQIESRVLERSVAPALLGVLFPARKPGRSKTGRDGPGPAA